MNEPIPLFQLNPRLDTASLTQQFQADGRLQIRDFLTEQSARTIHSILSRETPWGLAWQAGSDGPHSLRRHQLASMAEADLHSIGSKVQNAAARKEYTFLYGQYPMLDAYLQKWREGGPHDLLLEHINDQPLLSLVRTVTGIPEIEKADAQATFYGAGHFLSLHDDSHQGDGWRVAYVMSFCLEEWRPEWGGYLLFYDEEGDVVQGFKPRFNALNIFRVPQKHAVSYVPPFAPPARFAITGWFRDR